MLFLLPHARLKSNFFWFNSTFSFALTHRSESSSPLHRCRFLAFCNLHSYRALVTQTKSVKVSYGPWWLAEVSLPESSGWIALRIMAAIVGFIARPCWPIIVRLVFGWWWWLMTKRRTLSDGEAIGRVLKDYSACFILFLLHVHFKLGTDASFFCIGNAIECQRDGMDFGKTSRKNKVFVDWALEA